MRRIFRRSIFLGCAVVLLTLAATAQENRSEISLQGNGFFTRDASGNGTAYSTTETGGLLATYRYHLNRWISAEGVYGYDLDSQKYSASSEGFRIQSGIHQFTGGLVFNLPSRASSRFNPYILAGGGALVFEPTGNLSNTVAGAQSQAKGAFVYGVGFNYAIRKRWSVRAEFRGLVYSAPDFGFVGFNTNSVTLTAVPSLGISYRF
jgi:outer membrane immunogenic protein